MQSHRVHPSLTKYAKYLGTIPLDVQLEWVNIYGEDFVLKHIGEARLHEMATTRGGKATPNRFKFLVNWFIRAREKEEAMESQARASAQLAEEMRQKRKQEERRWENTGV